LRKALFCIAGSVVLFGCMRGKAPTLSCPALRDAYDRAFEQAVEEGAAKRFDAQKRYMSAGQNAYLAMQKQGCCDQADVCPNLNVN